MIDLTPIANAIISLSALLITTFLIPWIKAKISAEKLAEAQKWVTIAVQAAEMIYTESGLNKTKKNYVRSYLINKGYDFDADSINAMIESAVLTMKQNNPDVIAVELPGRSDSGD